ncbi:MAG: hypothetical protein RQ824_10530 [bacterium]|nr:hypothetical protein [bacterium]
MKRFNLDAVTHSILICIFLLFLFAPPIKTLFSPKKSWSVAEKRKLASMPDVGLFFKEPKEFLIQFEAYFNDHFGFREELIKRYSKQMKKLFGKSGISKVLRGKNDWYYYSEADIIQDFQGLDLFNEEELFQWKESLEKKREWLAKKGISYLYVVPPNKPTIYPEYLPDHLRNARGKARIDQLLEYLSKNSNEKPLDLRKALLKAKEGGQIYFRTDSHWNSKGAIIGYQEIMEQLRDLFPSLKSLNKYQLVEKSVLREDGDLSLMANLSAPDIEEELHISVKDPCAREETPYFTVIKEGTKMAANSMIYTKCQSSKLKAVIFRDSFFKHLLPFVAENFGEAIYILGYYDHHIMEQVLSEFKPDIVIEEVVERNLKNRSIKKVLSQLSI